jgi:hypothetical protein
VTTSCIWWPGSWVQGRGLLHFGDFTEASQIKKKLQQRKQLTVKRKIHRMIENLYQIFI